MREIRDQIIIIHKESMKRFNQLYRKLYSNPYLGHQFHLTSWWYYYIGILFYPLNILINFIVPECSYYINSYPPEVISCILQIILWPLYLITMIAIYVLSMILVVIVFIIWFPWCCLSDRIFPMNIELSRAYYRDMFGSNPDLNPPVIIDEMSDKLRSIVDNYRPLPSTTSFDYLRFVKETRRIKYTVSWSSEGDNYTEERELVVTGSFIEFIKHV